MKASHTLELGFWVDVSHPVGEGWNQVEPAKESELLAQLQEGEFWVEEEEFLREFDEVTIGYPVTEAGHLQSLYTGKTASRSDCPLGSQEPA